MVSLNANWPGSATTEISNQTISNGNALASSAISCDGGASLEIGIKGTYHASATTYFIVEIFKTIDGGTTWESTNDLPFAFGMVKNPGNTVARSITLSCLDVSAVKVNIKNNTGQALTGVYVYSQLSSVESA